MTFGSLFSGVGGFDIGFERSGMECAWQIEKDARCLQVLERHWPAITKHGDIKTANPSAVDVIAGGDPCPSHSKARSIWGAKHPDLSGYFLALVGRLRPRWVVRENVPSPSSARFATALEYIGYRSLVVEIDAAGVTGQSRQRQFVIGCDQERFGRLIDCLAVRKDASWSDAPRTEAGSVAACLTTHPCRYDSRDNYVWSQWRGLRILDGDEREKLAGFPAGWTQGFSEGVRAKFYGNAVVPAVAQWIGERIMETAA